MKAYFSLLLLILALNFKIFGQLNKMPIEEIVDRIRQVDLFIKYGKFKDTVEQDIKLLAHDPKITPEDFQKLNTAYNEMRIKYNRFLDVIKSDLSKWSQIKAMAKDPDGFASKYMDEYEAVLIHYQTSFSKEYQDVENNINRSKGIFNTKGLGLGTILLLIDEARPIIKAIVGWIRERRDDKDEAKNKILLVINERLFAPLEMKAWEKTVKASLQNKPEDNKKNQYIENEDLTLIDSSEFKGNLYFTWCTEGCNDVQTSNAKKIEFKPTPKPIKTKTVTVTTFDGPSNDKLQKALRYSSSRTYGEGYMQLKINTDAAVYVFAYNTVNDKKIEPIYPFPAEELRSRGYSDNQIGTTKSITVTPFFSSSEDATRTLPAPMMQNGKEVPLFMNVTPDSEQEYVVVLISKKQLPDDFYQDVEDADGSNIETKLYNVLDNQLLSSDNPLAKISNAGNEIHFDASELKEGLVLGFIFVVRH